MTRHLEVAQRAWTVRAKAATVRGGRRGVFPPYVVVIDTETRTDLGQGLLYGGYLLCQQGSDGRLTRLEEGLIFADDLPDSAPDEYALLRTYAATHPADVDRTHRLANWRLQLRSRSEFVEQVLWRAGYKGRATIVMFNAPFDWSRLAIGAAAARGDAGAFSLRFFHQEQFRFRVGIHSLDSKRALKQFLRPRLQDEEDTLDLDEDRHSFAGHLLDLRTLVFALTNASHTLESACRAFAVEHGKLDAPEHGTITTAHVDYCRRDVLATAELYEKTMAEFGRHPIDLQATRAYSPASLAKAYLRQMNVQPILHRQPDFDAEILGAAMSAFYGGRAEIHHRCTPLPVQLVDFTSMYPTVVALLGLWQLLTADHTDCIDTTEQTQRLLDTATLETVFDKQTWPGLVGIAQIIPDGDILPTRAEYGPEPGHSIAVNHLTDCRPAWYALPDLLASTLLTGRPPQILRAIQFVGHGKQPYLQPIQLRGRHLIDPTTSDPFTAAVEQRQRLKRRVARHPSECPCASCRDGDFFKVFANSGAYGIFAEMIRHDLPAKTNEAVMVHVGDGQPWTLTVDHPESPGEYCFPPIAACITAAARLMLAALERSVADAGGDWVFCDTDSMAIITRTSDEVGDSQPAGLSGGQLDTILTRFTTLSPYDIKAVPGSILRREPDGSGTCVAISAKRYAIYNPATLHQHITQLRNGDPCELHPLLKRSEHGLGHLLNPTAPNASDRDWIDQLWIWLLANLHGWPSPRAQMARPAGAQPRSRHRPTTSGRIPHLEPRPELGRPDQAVQFHPRHPRTPPGPATQHRRALRVNRPLQHPARSVDRAALGRPLPASPSPVHDHRDRMDR